MRIKIYPPSPNIEFVPNGILGALAIEPEVALCALFVSQTSKKKQEEEIRGEDFFAGSINELVNELDAFGDVIGPHQCCILITSPLSNSLELTCTVFSVDDSSLYIRALSRICTDIPIAWTTLLKPRKCDSLDDYRKMKHSDWISWIENDLSGQGINATLNYLIGEGYKHRGELAGIWGTIADAFTSEEWPPLEEP
ncbi:hypothetical protein [cf. Phormidesmis sp. LEGE 11477]|uniref:hypothetical protein n=1 Tax=cf. Phormidesmis sp. LEGE 11477 TaxID=1828680 RepID=UPI00187E3674|nr:hypothetical protein [cf. Phormidesmis sp. LEGE 11477]MBE9062221.1 hypothetical protein [cf. Phormidesmis sp. LEGE 11477]